MAGLFEYLRFRAFAQATEDPERVKQAMRTAAQAPKLDISETSLEGSHKNPIVVLEGDVRAVGTVRAAFGALKRDDPDGWERLLDEAPRRLDEHLNFYFRLDKQEAYKGRCILTSEDDGVTVRARLRSLATKQNGPLQELTGFLREIDDPVRRQV